MARANCDNRTNNSYPDIVLDKQLNQTKTSYCDLNFGRCIYLITRKRLRESKRTSDNDYGHDKIRKISPPNVKTELYGLNLLC